MFWSSVSTTARVVGVLTVLVSSTGFAFANPTSKPYIPFRTDPKDHDHLHHTLEWNNPVQPEGSKLHQYDPDNAVPDNYCPLHFSLGVSQRLHSASTDKAQRAIVKPPVIFPILPALGPGRQVLYTTQYEHLDLLTPLHGGNPTGGGKDSSSAIKEGLVQQVEYPLLFESSSFLTSPVLADVNADGIIDVILTDYDGGIYAMGLQASPKTGQRYFHKAQAPRLHVRRHWMESRINETLGIDPHEGQVEETPEEKAKEDKDAISMTDDTPMDRYRGGQQEKPHDPYHSYFEYTYGSSKDHETILRGVTANILGQDHDHVQMLEERRKRKIQHFPEDETTGSEPGGQFEDEIEDEEIKAEAEISGDQGLEENHRRLQQVIVDPTDQNHRRLEEAADAPTPHDREGVHKELHQEKKADSLRHETPDESATTDGDSDGPENALEDAPEGVHEKPDEMIEGLDTNIEDGDDDRYSGDDIYRGFHGDDMMIDRGMFSGDEETKSDDVPPVYGDDDYPRYDDYDGRYSSDQDEYYDDKHYVRIPPHILCDPVAVELPKLYAQNGETETLLFVAVSYYLDEDEYEGHFSYKRFKDMDNGGETEVQRGMYLANAIMVYQFGESPRWGRQEHLDMSADHSAPINTTLVGAIPLQGDNTKMGAFALSSPTIADIDGDGTTEVIIGTSMGMIYILDARNLYSREGWPVQFQRGIESRILVEDVRDDTNLEIFVADVGGTVACLNHKGEKLWHRDLVADVSNGVQGAKVLAASPMTLGDVDGDGMLDLILVLQIRIPDQSEAKYLFAISADSGNDLSRFPLHIGPQAAIHNDYSEEFVVEKLPAALLVDLHSDQSWLESYLHRGGTTFVKPTLAHSDKPPHGGPHAGLHIVLPVGKNLVVTEGASGCSQTISIGIEMLTMVQADDVHGKGSLDLVITTASGNVITLESPAPFHPLNVWNNGESRGRINAFAHGYSASQGIFVHDVSRQYRDIFGVYVPVTFEIFDNRPNINNELSRKVYNVEVRVGTSLAIFRKEYTKVGVFTERMYIPYGPGYYQLSVVLKSTHGLVYEDTFHVGYNVNYMQGFALMLWLPLLIASVCIFLCSTSKTNWDDDDYEGDRRNSQAGILGGPLPE